MRIKNYISCIVPLLFVVAATPIAVIAARSSQQVVEHVEEVVVKEQYRISPYDKMFQDVGKEYGVDWLLLSAIASAESEFRFDAVSKAGAVGLMQIMPMVAKNMGYERSQLFDAEISAEIAARLLVENRKMLHLDSDMVELEQLKFMLACYNAGYSRIADARRLAVYYEDNPDQWSIVATYLSLLAEPEYAEHEVVVSGPFYGSAETVVYVDKVMHLYNIYRNSIFR